MSQPHWSDIADDAAVEAHEGKFSSHRGCWELTGERDAVVALVLYDNHPYAASPLLRTNQIAKLKVSLEGLGHAVLAEGEYPFEGVGAGYTVTLVVQTDAAGVETVLSEWRKVIDVSTGAIARMTERKRKVKGGVS